MLLIAQIILTVFAWRKGWKWYSLIPMVSAFFIGILLGAVSGGDINSVIGLGYILDIAAIIILIILNVKAPKPIENKSDLIN